VPVAWVSLQLGKGLLNVAGGRASDQFGRRPVLVIAWILYAISYAGFGLVGSWPVAWGVLAIYAFHYGFAEGGQRALLAELVPSAARGRAFGIQQAIEGLAVLPANVIFGLVYSRVSATAAFMGSAAIALCAAAALLTVTTERR
jgi:MFS family permease